MTDEKIKELAEHAETKMLVELHGNYAGVKKYKDGYIDGYKEALKNSRVESICNFVLNLLFLGSCVAMAIICYFNPFQ